MTLYRQKMIAMAMLATAAFAVLRVTGDFVYPLIVCLVGLLSFSQRLKLQLRPAQRTILVLVITLLFALKYRFFAPIQPIAYTNLSWQVPWRTVAQYFLALMAMQFFIPVKKNLTTAIPLLGLVCFFSVAHLTDSPQFDYLYHLLILLFLLLTMIYTSSYRNEFGTGSSSVLSRKQLLAGFVALTALSVGWWFAKTGYEQIQQIDINLNRFYMTMERFGSRGGRNRSLGFSETTELTSIKKFNLNSANRVAIRVFSEREPGYLRAKAFDYYENSRWESRLDAMDIFPDAYPLKLLPESSRNNIFTLTGTFPTEGTVLDVWPDPDIEIAIYAPLETTALSLPVPEIVLDEFQIPDADQLRGGVNYQVLKTPGREFSIPSSETFEKALSLPPEFEEEVQTLSEKIFGDAKTDRERIRAIESYFHTQYQYNLGIQIPRDRDALMYFLEEKPAAHCEYFASGAALLLRTVGVPTRYVTGFVCSEKNTYTGYWMARNRDAHAWVEAWNREAGRWQIVEATPPSGLPMGYQANRMSYFWDYLKYLRQELRVAIYAGGLQGFFGYIGEKIRLLVLFFVTSPVGIPISIGIGLLVIRAWIIRHRKSQEQFPDAFTLRLDRLRNKVDRRLTRSGFRRERAETLDQFIERIHQGVSDRESVSNYTQWYSDYIQLRFGAERNDESIESLAKRLPTARIQKTVSTASS